MKKKLIKRIGWTILALFLLMNVVAFFHAYKFTHFSNTTEAKTKSEKLSFGGKMKKDERVTRQETDIIYSNMKGKKHLVTFPLAGHENYLNKYADEWEKEVKQFLEEIN